MISAEIYSTESEEQPFSKWVKKLKDRSARTAILNRLDRVALGNFGDCKSVGEGVYELRIHKGPGYRVYFGRYGKTVVILLTGGSKKTQQADIADAIAFWKDYLERKNTKEKESV
jgi:putative addiction module killer protein